MRSLRRTTLYSLALGCILFLLAPGSATGGSPAMHWGSMDLATSHKNCLGRARKAFADAGVRNMQNTGWQMYGEKGDANVLVSCAPRSNASAYLLVVATSGDSKAAELLRNDVRSRIARMREID